MPRNEETPAPAVETNQPQTAEPAQEEGEKPVTYIVNGVRVDPNGEPVDEKGKPVK